MVACSISFYVLLLALKTCEITGSVGVTGGVATSDTYMTWLYLDINRSASLRQAKTWLSWTVNIELGNNWTRSSKIWTNRKQTDGSIYPGLKCECEKSTYV